LPLQKETNKSPILANVTISMTGPNTTHITSSPSHNESPYHTRHHLVHRGYVDDDDEELGESLLASAKKCRHQNKNENTTKRTNHSKVKTKAKTKSQRTQSTTSDSTTRRPSLCSTTEEEEEDDNYEEDDDDEEITFNPPRKTISSHVNPLTSKTINNSLSSSSSLSSSPLTTLSSSRLHRRSKMNAMTNMTKTNLNQENKKSENRRITDYFKAKKREK
jgi:hypothetical protein